MPARLRSVSRVAGWMLLQASVVLLLLYQGAMHRDTMERDLSREEIWTQTFWLFVGLAVVANGVLEWSRLGDRRASRLAVWVVVGAVLVLSTLAEWASYPLAVPFILGAAVIAIALRETLNGLAGPRPERA